MFYLTLIVCILVFIIYYMYKRDSYISSPSIWLGDFLKKVKTGDIIAMKTVSGEYNIIDGLVLNSSLL